MDTTECMNEEQKPGYSAQSDHCALSESVETTGCMNGEQRPGYFARVQDDLKLYIWCMFEGAFLLDAAKINVNIDTDIFHSVCSTLFMV